MLIDGALVQSSLDGSLQLLTLCAGGALLARQGVLDQAACASWSKAIFKLFLPLLLFLSIMETVHNARRDMHADMSADPLQLILPPVWAFVVLAVSAIVGKLAIRMFVHDRDEAVRRILFVALLLGNANNLPLLLIRSLCMSYQPFKEDATCVARGTSYMALFVTPWNSIMWTFVLSYVMRAAHHEAEATGTYVLTSPTAIRDSKHPDEERIIMEATERNDRWESSTKSDHTNSCENRDDSEGDTVETATPNIGNISTNRNWLRGRMCILSEHQRSMLFSPPVIAIACAAILANMDIVAGTFLEDGGILRPLRQAMSLMGAMVVPGSSLIVGARLHAYWQSQHCGSPTERIRDTGEHTLLRREICALVGTRFIVMPIIGRLLVRLTDYWFMIDDDLLRIYLMIPFFMPTASNSVVMVQMLAQRDACAGMRMEKALLTLMFWQYAVAPIFLTANIALGLVDLEWV